MADEIDYLTPDFDAATLTVPRLRSILVQNDVTYPSSAKKSQLIDIFNDSVKPQARRLLKSRTNTKRSARGIEDVASSRETSVASTEEEELEEVEEEPAPLRSPPRSARRATRQSTFDSVNDEVEEEAPRTVRATRRTSVIPPRLSPADAAVEQGTPRSPAHRVRQIMATPAIKVEDHDEPVRRDGQSPFSTANPFQSGSPQYTTPSAATGPSRRRTLGPTPAASEVRSASARRRTDFAPKATSSKLDLTDGGLIPRKRYPKEESLEPETGEEFTPEAQHELEEEAAETGQQLTRPAKRQKRNGSKNPMLAIAPWAISFAMLSGLSAVWRQEKIEVGFCGVGRPSTALAGVQVPEWASFVQPQCEPCPPHAYCYQNMQVSCEPDFVLKPHPLSLGGAIPLAPTCEPDGEKARKVKTVADRAVEELRERNAKWECGELKDERGKRVRAPVMQEPELKKVVETQKKRSMSQEEFEDLWAAAIGDIVQREEVGHSVDGQTGARILRSTSLANISLGCAVRRSVRVTLERYLRQLVLLVFVIASVLYGRYSILDARSTEARAKQLAGITLERLAAQATYARTVKGSGDEEDESYISVNQLRDDVLREEFSSKTRQKLWQKVQMKVEGNSNVRSMVREGRSGEVGRVWEWIGALGAIESPRRGMLEGRSTPVKEEMEQSVVSTGGGKSRSWGGDRPVY